VTDDNGRYAFEGIPSGPSTIVVRASSLRSWDREKRIYLRAKPITHPEWQIGPELNRAAMQLEDIDKDVLDLDFQYCFWSSKHGFLDTSPDGQPVPRRKQGALSKLADAFKRLTNTASLSGRVLDAPGNGLRGAQVRIEIVRRVDDDEKGKEQVIGSWTVKADADGKFALPAVPMPPPEQYRVRVQIVADGHVEMQKAFPLNELVKPGTRALRIPDLRLEIQDRE